MPFYGIPLKNSSAMTVAVAFASVILSIESTKKPLCANEMFLQKLIEFFGGIS